MSGASISCNLQQSQGEENAPDVAQTLLAVGRFPTSAEVSAGGIEEFLDHAKAESPSLAREEIGTGKHLGENP